MILAISILVCYCKLKVNKTCMADDALRMPSGLHTHEDTYNDDPDKYEFFEVR